MASYNHYQPLSSTTWVIPHNLNSTFLAIDVFTLSGNGVYQKVQPQQYRIIDNNTVSVVFNTAVQGRGRIVSNTNK